MTHLTKINPFRAFAARFVFSASGAVKIEYALLVFLIGIVLIGALEAIGISIIDILTRASEGIESGQTT